MLKRGVLSCNACSLAALMPNKKCVPGFGPIDAKIMLVGEALGRDEAQLRKPFVGRCGKFLDHMLDKSGLDRKDIYITNVVKGRPYVQDGKFQRNRPPEPEEINSCKKWLWQEIQVIKPKIIITAGKIPTFLLLGLTKKDTLKNVAGLEHKVSYTDAIIIPIYHPSYIMSYQLGLEYGTISHLEKVKKIVYG